MIRYIPKWTDEDGNLFLFLARNHCFDSWDEAFKFQIENYIFYVPVGFSTAGIHELEVDENGNCQIAHVPYDNPWHSNLALIAGPAFNLAANNPAQGPDHECMH